MFVDSYAFDIDPSRVSGLVRAWRPDQGVTLSPNEINIPSVAGAWGTTVSLAQSGTQRPDLATGLSPKGLPLFELTSSRSECWNFTAISSLTSFTIALVVAPKTMTGGMGVLGSSASASMYLQIAVGTGASGQDLTTKLQMRAGATDVNHDLTMPSNISKNVQVMLVTYDASEFVPWRAGVKGTAVAASNLTFSFDILGALRLSANPLNGYLGPVLIWNRKLTDNEARGISEYLIGQWRPNVIYLANTGSDSSTTPWKSTTPYATYAKALKTSQAGVTVAPKAGASEYIRVTTARVSTSANGTSSSQPNIVNGTIWGTGKAQLRFSNAPNVTNTSGTIYSLAGTYTVDQIPAGLNPGTDFGYIYYVPGGLVSNAADYSSTNVVRLTYQSSSPTTPASGTWAWDSGTGKVYVNAGVALSNGEIEVWADSIGTPILVNPMLIAHDNWKFKGIVNSFAEDKGWDNFGRANITLEECEAWFVGSDGFDSFDDGANLARNVLMDRCVAFYCGRGATDSGAYGDGFSMHNTSEVTFLDCRSYNCDKSGFNHVHDTVTVHERCYAIGTMPYRHHADNDDVGSMDITNCIGVVPAGALYPHGASNSAAVNSPLTVTNCTLVSEDGTGNGIHQVDAAAVITAQNTILTGFDKGIAGISGTVAITANHNALFDNNTNYENVAAGSGDVLADPLFTDAGNRDFTLLPGSPCLGAGADLGVTEDFDGNTRTVPPDIGAHER